MGVNFVIALFGMAMDIALAIVTFKSKHLRENSTFVFIACESLSNGMLSYAGCVLFAIFVSGANFVDDQSCFYALAICVVGYGYSSLALPLMALDRLLAVLVPLWWVVFIVTGKGQASKKGEENLLVCFYNTSA
ncbi:serpentine type 7TM GPCR chemoreceptor srsx domain-containing protein [Ditylenchus destructor]|uniref:Serpentine type 7TM GPCR chemoreceptor srsx domain-containing protein n=1 Tax=Ditylenchus destructor TaxID=166010 RepID=A0AAD4MYE0_9BILA|nr:serpentine type 7TM GPCR chemoreceptor srsx domain-containing protein [Ditylenchus destructor]